MHTLFGRFFVNGQKLLLVLALACASQSLSAQTGDVLLDVLRTALQKNFTELGKQDVKPYFMSYRVEDRHELEMVSSFGYLQKSSNNHYRTFLPEIRIGTMQEDVSATEKNSMLPVADSPRLAMEEAVWTGTEKCWQTALNLYKVKLGFRKDDFKKEDKAGNFSPAPVAQYYEEPLPPSAFKVDTALWRRRLNEVSQIFRGDSNLINGDVRLEVFNTRIYVVNSEGTSVVENQPYARIILSAAGIADDGIELPLHETFFAFSPDSLPSVDHLQLLARDLAMRVRVLRKAPLADPYTGPAILSGEVAGVFFHEIFGHRLEGHRLKEGGETFRDKIGQQVLPAAFQVYSDPTCRWFEGKDLSGSYTYDKEGVKARRVNNVVNGTLKEFLLNRVPVDSFPASNGHGRANALSGTVSRQSNLFIKSTRPKSQLELDRELVREMERQGKEYAYYFASVTSGYTYTGEDGSINSFNVTPLEVYKVYADGRPDELVRGTNLIGTPLLVFSKILAASDKYAVFNGSCGAESGWVPVATVAPDILVSQIETQRQRFSRASKRILPPPPVTGRTGSDDDIIFSAMQDEMTRGMDSLRRDDKPLPFWMMLVTDRYRKFNVKAVSGSLMYKVENPWSTVVKTRVLLGDFHRTNEFRGRENNLAMPSYQELTYDGLRHTLWQALEQSYNTAVLTASVKEIARQRKPLPAVLDKLDDQEPVPAVTCLENDTMHFDRDRLERTACRLSAIFNEYKSLFHTQVSFDVLDQCYYKLTSEQVRLKKPVGKITLKVSASVVGQDSVKLDRQFEYHYMTMEEMPSDESLEASVRKFADGLMALAKAPLLNDNYKGPVLFTNGGASEFFFDNFLQRGFFIGSVSDVVSPNSSGELLGRQLFDKRINVDMRSDLTHFEGRPVFGHYQIDAEGVRPPRQLRLVDHGVFRKMLIGTAPSLYAPHSTGCINFPNNPLYPHQIGASATLCFVPESGGKSLSAMEKMVRKAAKEKGQSYYYVIDGDSVTRLLNTYRVSVSNGKRELVLTNSFPTVTLTQMKNMIGFSSKLQMENIVGMNTNSLICPQFFAYDDVELSRCTLSKMPPFALSNPKWRQE